MLNIFILDVSLHITKPRLQPHISGANELKHWPFKSRCHICKEFQLGNHCACRCTRTVISSHSADRKFTYDYSRFSLYVDALVELKWIRRSHWKWHKSQELALTALSVSTRIHSYHYPHVLRPWITNLISIKWYGVITYSWHPYLLIQRWIYGTYK